MAREFSVVVTDPEKLAKRFPKFVAERTYTVVEVVEPEALYLMSKAMFAAGEPIPGVRIMQVKTGKVLEEAPANMTAPEEGQPAAGDLGGASTLADALDLLTQQPGSPTEKPLVAEPQDQFAAIPDHLRPAQEEKKPDVA